MSWLTHMKKTIIIQLLSILHPWTKCDAVAYFHLSKSKYICYAIRLVWHINVCLYSSFCKSTKSTVQTSLVIFLQ